MQSHGTARVGRVFGPVTLVWFVTIAVLGIVHIVREPRVFAALNPLYGIRFFAQNGWNGFLVLGSVFLVVTGGEALYADMGHFGRRPIRLAWYGVVLPALLLNYFGQGALLIHHPEAVENPFFHMAPRWALYPVVVIATMAAVIASQALITGAYSLTMQAVQLGYIPRVQIDHTSARERGQIYIPQINWVLMLACIGLVLGFRTSSNVAAAYGVAVTTTMVITTLLLFRVARERWRWPLWAAVLFTGGVPGDRPGVLGRQHRQDPGRRLVPAGGGRGDLHADVHVEDGAAHPGGAAERGNAPDRAVPEGREVAPAATGAGDGRVHVQQSRRARRRRCCTA